MVITLSGDLKQIVSWYLAVGSAEGGREIRNKGI